MSGSVGLRRLLESWPHDPEKPTRIVRGDNGHKMVQFAPRWGWNNSQCTVGWTEPDARNGVGAGTSPTVRVRSSRGQQADSELNAEDCNEGTLYYLRHQDLFQLERCADTVRDTARSLVFLTLCVATRHVGRTGAICTNWQLYILRMNAVASAMLSLEQGDATRSLQIIRTAHEQIAALETLDDETSQVERRPSQTGLRELEPQVRKRQPISHLERLGRELRRAIERQEFKRAPKWCDRHRALRAQRSH